MLVLAHAGITLGTAGTLALVLKSRQPTQATAVPTSWVTELGRKVDIRLLFVGSLLPDIIDKPVGQVFFRETFSDGRIFSHTLVFLTIISLVGLYLYRRYARTWLLALAFGTLSHLFLDDMWNSPHTLFWPFFGFAFERHNLSNWVANIWQALFTNPGTYLPELLGAAIILWFGVVLIRRRKLFAFIRRGQVE